MAIVKFRAPPAAEPGLRTAWRGMRKPVASMFALATDALAEPGLSQPTRERLEQILEQARWLADLIDHSPPTGPGAPAGCQTNLLRVVNDAVAAERATWPGDVRIRGVTGPVFTAVHSVPLRRAVANLLSNATRAAGPAGTVTVDVGYDRRSAVLAVEDSGPGFGKIERGLGLGLVAVSRCITAYSGRLTHRRGANGGARVILRLPAVIDSAPRLPVAKPEQAETQRPAL
jgi:signal transduction histidine kinase